MPEGAVVTKMDSRISCSSEELKICCLLIGLQLEIPLRTHHAQDFRNHGVPIFWIMHATLMPLPWRLMQKVLLCFLETNSLIGCSMPEALAKSPYGPTALTRNAWRVCGTLHGLLSWYYIIQVTEHNIGYYVTWIPAVAGRGSIEFSPWIFVDYYTHYPALSLHHDSLQLLW